MVMSPISRACKWFTVTKALDGIAQRSPSAAFVHRMLICVEELLGGQAEFSKLRLEPYTVCSTVERGKEKGK